MSGFYIAQKEQYEGDSRGNDWWHWEVWIEPKQDLERIAKVTYFLHPSFRNPVRVLRDASTQFMLHEQGWGEFTINAEISFVDKDRKPLRLQHSLKLTFPDSTDRAPRKEDLARSFAAVPRSEIQAQLQSEGPTPIAAEPGDAPIRIFVSHTGAPHDAIAELRQRLGELSPGRVTVKSSDEFDVDQSPDAQQRLELELRGSDLMAILVRGSEGNANRSFFEWGYFNGTRDPKERRALVVRAPGTTLPIPVAPSSVYNSTPSEVPNLLFGLLMLPIRSDVKPLFEPGSVDYAFIAPLAEATMRAVGQGPPVVVDFAMRLYIEVDSVDVCFLDTGIIPSRARVTGNPNALEVLGVGPNASTGPVVWENVTSALKPAADDDTPGLMWTDHLAKLLGCASRADAVNSALPNFFSPAKQRVFRPTLTRFERQGDGGCLFEISFTELPAEVSVYTWPPGSLGAITHILTLARMFRWGVLEPYSRRLNHLAEDKAAPADVDLAYRELDAAINNVIVDGQNRGISHSLVSEALSTDEIRRYDALNQAWGETFAGYREAVAKPERATADVLEFLHKMSEVNEGYLRLFAGIYARLIDRYFSDQETKIEPVP